MRATIIFNTIFRYLGNVNKHTLRIIKEHSETLFFIQ